MLTKTFNALSGGLVNFAIPLHAKLIIIDWLRQVNMNSYFGKFACGC
jgi:hypothetical protein